VFTWSYDDPYLPAIFHSKDGFKTLLGELRVHMLGQYHVCTTMVLAFGMMLREFDRTEFTEPNATPDPEMPDHVHNTPLGIPEMDMVLRLLNDTL